MKLHVEWLEDDRYVDGGRYIICKANHHLFLDGGGNAGRCEKTRKNLLKVCDLWNADATSRGF